MRKNASGISFIILLLCVIGILLLMISWPNGEQKPVYSDLVNAINQGEIAELKIEGTLATAKYKEKLENGKDKIVEFEIPSGELLYLQTEKSLERQIKAKEIRLKFPAASTLPMWLSLLSPLLIIAVLVLLWTFYMRQAGGGMGKATSFGKTKAKLMSNDAKKVTFNDVAGVEEEKEELTEIVEFLKAPKKFVELGARIPKGVLLVGPPGTGKTLLAKAVAGEADAPFFSISGSDFVEMFVGVGASRVRDLFDQAKKSQPSIIFIDEIDAVGRHRGAGLGGGHDEREQTLNQLLVEMDGFGVNEGVIVIAATNRSDILDPALMRPGRFDRQVYVGYPDKKGREAILLVHSRNKPLGKDVNIETVAKTTYGFTGADLENLLNEAALLAARKNKKEINQPDLDEAMIKVVMGPEKKSKEKTEQAKRMTAYHEAGHAIVTTILPTQDPVHQVSIISRGQAGGYTMFLPDVDKSYVSKTEMEENIVVSMGGRVAEELIFGEINTGAYGDINQATKVAKDMVTKYGMSEKLGSISYSSTDEVFIGRDYGHSKGFSEDTAALIDQEVNRIVAEAYSRCKDIIKSNLDKLERVAHALIEREKLDGEEFLAVFNATE